MNSQNFMLGPARRGMVWRGEVRFGAARRGKVCVVKFEKVIEYGR